MFFTFDTWRVTAPMPALQNASSSWSQVVVNDDDLEAYCRVLRQNGIDTYSVTRESIAQSQIDAVLADEDCDCAKSAEFDVLNEEGPGPTLGPQ